MSPVLSPPCPSWRGRYRYQYGGYCHDPTSDTLPEPVRRFLALGPPPVYIGLGSVQVDDPARFTALLRDAVLHAGCRAIVASGWTGLGAGLSSSYLLVVGELDHQALFPLTAGVVHHGGSGTTHTAARAGVPQLVLPQLADQYYWGHRAHVLGIGPAAIAVSRVTASKLGRAIGELLHEPSYALEAARMGRILRADRGVDAAVAVIEAAAGGLKAKPVRPPLAVAL